MCANKWVIVLVGVLLVAGCRSIPEAPLGAVPKRRFIPTDAYGGWATVFHQEEISGELIVVGPDSLYLLDNLGLKVFALHDIQRAEVFCFRTSQQGFVTSTVFASVFALINGPLSLVTFPLAITSGILTAFSEGKRINRYDYPANSWTALSVYARFPQGLPVSVDRAALKQKAGIRLERRRRR